MTVLKRSEALLENPTNRLDSEFVLKDMLKTLQLISRHPNESISSLVTKVQHPTELVRKYEESGLQIVLGQNVRNNFFDFAEKSYMHESARKKLTTNRVMYGDLLMTRSGANYGQTAAWMEQDSEAFACADLLIFRKPQCPSGYLSTFFSTCHGKRLIDRGAYGMAQPHIAPSYLETISVPRFSLLETQTDLIIKTSVEKFSEANKLLGSAEQTLLHALGLDGWQPPEPLTYTRRASEAFTVGRFDAEYFYPAKKAALDFLTQIPGRTIGEMFVSVCDLWQPDAATSGGYVRNYDLTDALSPFLDGTKPPILPDKILSTKKRISKGDIVVSRLRSYLREIAVVLDGGEMSMICSPEFIVLRPKLQSMRIETLLVYLRSTLPQLIFKWSQDGSNHPRFDVKELLKLRVPDIIREHEDEIAEQVQSAIASRQEARELLERAKRAVEVAIEDSEGAALAYLNGD